MAEVKLYWKKCDPKTDFETVPEKAGVYIISTLQKIDYKYEVKYVGQASNLKERAQQHWSKNEQNTGLKNHIANGYAMKFSYAELPSQSERDGVELFLFKYFAPEYNKCTPPAKTSLMCDLPEVRKRK